MSHIPVNVNDNHQSFLRPAHIQTQNILTPDCCFQRSKKLSVPASVVSRIMGRGGCNITAIQDVTGAHIDVDKQKDKNGERMITIR